MQSIILLLCTGFTGCSGAGDSPVELRFAIEDFPDRERIGVRSLQLYVHDVELLDRDGRSHAFRTAAVLPWQSERVGLVDLGGSGGERNAVLRGHVAGRPADGFAGVRFVVGVPFELNHADPLNAAAPLDRPELFWTWQSGYKFLRVELAEDGREWAFHLGSTGCVSASAVRPPSAECAEPNRIAVEILGTDPVRDGVHFRLGELVRAMRAADYEPCMGNYAHVEACAEPFATTGLDAVAGAQRLFAPAR